MLVAKCSSIPSFPSSTQVGGIFRERHTVSSSSYLRFSSKFSAKASVKRTLSNAKNTDDACEVFSALSSDIPWEENSIWSTMGLYFFSLHIPLSFGGLSVVANVMHQPVLDPRTEAVSILLIQIVELCGAWALLNYTAKPHSKVASFLQGCKFSKKRNWVQSSAVGFGVLILIVLLSSFLADRLIGPKVVNNSILKEIISSGSVSRGSLFFTYCFVTPFLEEIVYRGFLLASLASTMKWQRAVIISSFIFSAAHFSSENSLQLFVIGCVLGCSYCWSGYLGSSFVLHSLYNTATLLVTILS